MVGFFIDEAMNKSYLVLEHAGEKNLAEFVQQTQVNTASKSLAGPAALNEELVRSIMLQLLQVTDYLHTNRICHRDLKPDNVLVTARKDSPGEMGGDSSAVQIKVIDFNVAVQLSNEDDLIMGSTGLREWSAPETR